MINIEKQIEYWLNGAFDDLKSAKVLIEKNRLLHGLFFCHLVIEKTLKAHFVKITSSHPPRTHNLFNLLERVGLVLDDEDEIFLGILMKYQLEGRYPDYKPNIPDVEKVNQYLKRTE